MNTMKTRDIVALGFMTFALFVGAGNIIFPPFIGLNAGNNVWLAATGFLLTGVGLPVITIIALARVGGLMNCLTSPIGKVAGTVLSVVCYLLIGPLLATPRTTTVSFKVGLAPFSGDTWPALLIYSFVYFLIVLVISLYPNKILDIVGRVLGPIKIISLAILGLAAFIFPAGLVGEIKPAYVSSAFGQGFQDGYLTMDALGALVFGVIVVNAIRSRNVHEPKLIIRYSIIASLMAGVGLCLVYISLFKLGNDSHAIAAGAVDGTDVLHAYVSYTFGEWGAEFLGVLITVACLVTAIGLTTSCGTYFSWLFKVPYTLVVIVSCILAFAVSNVGLAQLIKYSEPVLKTIYPPCIVLVLLSLLQVGFNLSRYVFMAVTGVSCAFGLLDGLASIGVVMPRWLGYLPFAQQNFAWVVPVIVVFVIVVLADYMVNKKTKA